jgi:hypothetical protein
MGRTVTHPDKKQLLASHAAPWANLWIWLGFAAMFFTLQAVLGWVVYHGAWWAVLPLIVGCSLT